jgi:hypothetical protein
MAVDLSVFERVKGFSDYQRADEEFQLRKQLLAQNSLKDQLEVQAALATARNGGITPKDLIQFQLQKENNEANRDVRRESIEANRLSRQATLDARNDVLNEKKDAKFKLDQNLLNNALGTTQEQIDRIDRVFGKRDETGELILDPSTGQPVQPPVAGVERNYGVMDYLPNRKGSDAAGALAELSQVDAKGFMQAISDMKNQSATGASGLGALSEREGDKVQAAATAAADRNQDFQSAVKNALQYRKELAATQERLKGGFNNIYSNRQAPTQPVAPEGFTFYGTGNGGKPIFRGQDGFLYMDE